MAIVVSLLEPDLDSLRAAMARNAPLADLFELRLDRIGNPGEEVLRELRRASPKPLIVTVHGAEAFGDFAGSIEQRLELLQVAARAGAAFVDIDWRLSLELGEVYGKCHRIVSRHELAGTPEDLAALHEEQRAVLYEGDITKLVTHAERQEDGLRVLRHLRACGGGLIAFCSGVAGSFTRALAPIFGSPFTYAAPARAAGGRASAPGQLRVDELMALAPPGGFGPETAIFGILGRPVGHSWSPLLHGLSLKAAHLDAVYLAFEPDDLELFLSLADDENFRGFSITAPFKEEALRLAKGAEHNAEAAGAANTLVRDGQGWLASNTDVSALRDTLQGALLAHARRGFGELAPARARVLIVGAGGAARAAALATREVGAQLLISARRDERARLLCEAFQGELVPWLELGSARYDVLVHCTPAGSLAAPDELPFAAELLPRRRIVIEANYRPMLTPLLAEARARENTVVPGGEWFVRQALEQFERFTRRTPNEGLMRKTFEHAFDGERRAGRA
jgi:3-dehydroquinate dehydratase/shikimate dehydrogenase